MAESMAFSYKRLQREMLLDISLMSESSQSYSSNCCGAGIFPLMHKLYVELIYLIRIHIFNQI